MDNSRIHNNNFKDIECPNCGEWLDIDHDDGYGYEEGEVFRQRCPHCEKYFAYTTGILYVYEANKAECMNEGEHNFKPTHTFPIEATKMRCEDCGEERKPTEEEWKGIKKDDEKTN